MAPKIATAEAVGLSDLLDFVRPRHRMVLTTFRADGSLQSSPVTGGVDEQGRVVIASYPQRAKSANIRRTPKASVVVLSDEFNGAYVQIDGDAEVIDVPEAVESLVDYYRAIAGEHPDWDEYRSAMLDQRKCLIRVTPHKLGPGGDGRLSSGVTAAQISRVTRETALGRVTAVTSTALLRTLDLRCFRMGSRPPGQAADCWPACC